MRIFITQGHPSFNNSVLHSDPTPPPRPYSGFSDSLIQDLIYSFLVLPNRVTVPLVGDVQLAQLRFPMPKVGKL